MAPGNNALVGNEFAGLGLTVSQRDAFAMNVVQVGVGFAFAENANSPANVISASVLFGGGFTDVTDNFDFDLSTPRSAAGLWIGNVDPGSTIVQFLDGSQNIIHSETFTSGHTGIIGTPGGRNRIFYGITSDTPIATIRTIEGTGDSDGVTYDDIQFSLAPIPEPSRACLIAISAAAINFRRRRRP